MSTSGFSDYSSYGYQPRQNFNNSRAPVSLPVSTLPQDVPRDISGRTLPERLRNQDTTVRWISDPVNGQEKFQVTINIDGFQPNEVNMRMEGRKLIVYGEHIENKNQSTAKKIIEKSYELPQDVDPSSHRATFPGLNTMQIEFLSRHSNVLYDDGRTLSNIDAVYNPPLRAPTTGFKQERSSSEFTSTRKLGGSNQFDRNLHEDRRNSSTILSEPDRYHMYEELINDRGATNRKIRFADDVAYGTSSHRTDRPPIYETIGDSFNSTIPSTSSSAWRNENDNRVYENSFTETHREVEHRRSSPTSGVQTSREVEHHQSGSPSIARRLDQSEFRPSLMSGARSPSLPTRNTEVREYSRRIGTGNDGTTRITALPLFTTGFNSDAFYRSAFQPQILTDDHGEKHIEMKLDVSNYQPSEVKVSVVKHDLIVRAEHKDERPPTSSARSYFYKQVTLPPNTDLNSLSSDYLNDGTLCIKAKLFSEQTAIRYN